ncbi:hypothetical protein AAC387_Pa07g2218 [Persea americana]
MVPRSSLSCAVVRRSLSHLSLARFSSLPIAHHAGPSPPRSRHSLSLHLAGSPPFQSLCSSLVGWAANRKCGKEKVKKSKIAMQAIQTPKTPRAKRELEKHAPKLVENGKKTPILQGTKTSNVLNSVLTEIYHLKKGTARRYTKKNDNIRPFESGGETSLEFFFLKTDCSLFVEKQISYSDVTVGSVPEMKELKQEESKADLLVNGAVFQPSEAKKKRSLMTANRGERSSDSSIGISANDLELLPCFDFKAREKGNSPVDCAVCLENFKMGDKCRLLPNCNHSFH